MKYILIALLFCSCYVGEAQNDIHYGVTDGTYRIKKDTTKPLNIKMKPRWRDSLTLQDVFDADTVVKYGDQVIWWPPTIAYNVTEGKYRILPETDTTKVVLLVSDTSSQNGYKTQRCYWMYGNVVKELHNSYLGDMPVDSGFLKGDPYPVNTEMFKYNYWKQIAYLDDKKVPLSKNLVVWLSKEVK